MGSQRKAWNEAMRGSGAAIPRIGMDANNRRSSDRRKKQARRNQARKSTNEHHFSHSLDHGLFQAAMRIDTLEGVVDHGLGSTNDGASLEDGEEDYLFDAAAEDESLSSNRSKKKKRTSKRGNNNNARGSQSEAIPKRLQPRSLAALLMEDTSRSYGMTHKYLAAEARPLRSLVTVVKMKINPQTPSSDSMLESGIGGSTSKAGCDSNHNVAIKEEESSTTDPIHDIDSTRDNTHTHNNNKNILTRTTYQRNRSKRKFCPVTGLFGIYTDPKSGIPYADLMALEQIRERAPPWMNSSVANSGNATYFEAMNSLRGEE